MNFFFFKKFGKPIHKSVIKNKKIEISIVLLVKNAENYKKYLKQQFSEIETTFKDTYSFEFFFLENNSKDDSKKEIVSFFKKRKGSFWIDDLEKNNDYDGVLNERSRYMAFLRNLLKTKHGSLRSDYTVLLDCDVIFSISLIDDMIKQLSKIKNIVGLSPFGICYDSYLKHKNPCHYYDSLALITKDKFGHKQSANTCLFKQCEPCKKKRKNTGIVISEKYLLSERRLNVVDSLFGGFLLLRTSDYNNVRWDNKNNDFCEHHSFCQQLRKFGKIVLNPFLKVVTTVPDKRDYTNIYKTILS